MLSRTAIQLRWRPQTRISRSRWPCRTSQRVLHAFNNGRQSFQLCSKIPSTTYSLKADRPFSSAVSAIVTPPLVFIGLGLALWTWKCVMMILFQNKIIYMPNVPPFARSETMQDYTELCHPIAWEVKQIRSSDGTKLVVCSGTLVNSPARSEQEMHLDQKKHVLICYFQGNGGSLPPRLPMLSAILRSAACLKPRTNVQYSLLALSYRGYWQSSGRASEPGIRRDAQALLAYAEDRCKSLGLDTTLILWGQSIGSGVASTLAAAIGPRLESSGLPTRGLILETPFRSIKSMLVALYPQKWLPYRYLGPFLWNHWDTSAALRTMAAAESAPTILLLPAARDEVVPPIEAEELEKLCKDLGLRYERRDIPGALHNDASSKREGQKAVARFIGDLSQL